MTDVNIATELLEDLHGNKFDTALIISGDSDIVPPIKVLKGKYPDKRVIVAFPPARFSHEMRTVSDGYLIIGKANLFKSIFPDKVVKPDGFTLQKPKEWA